MRRLGVWGTGTVGLLMLGVVVATAADNDEEAKPPIKSNSWSPFGGWFGSGDAKPPAKTDNGQKRETGKDTKAGPAKRAREAKAALAEMDKWLRRQEVCIKLHQVARDTNDLELDRMASQLDKRAWELYRERTSKLPGAAVSLADDETLEQRLPVKSNDTARLMPSGDKAIMGKDLGSAAAVREVEP